MTFALAAALVINFETAQGRGTYTMIATPKPGQNKPEAAPTRRLTSPALDIRYVDNPSFRDPAQVARILESDLPERDEAGPTPRRGICPATWRGSTRRRC